MAKRSTARREKVGARREPVVRSVRREPSRLSRPPALPRSMGAVKLSAVELTHEEIAARLFEDRSLVTRWTLGERLPRTEQRRRIYAAFSIPATAWDEPAAIPSAGPVSSIVAKSYAQIGEELRGLVARLMMLASQHAEKDEKLFRRYTRDAVAAYGQLGRYTGETLQMPEERAARLPAVRRVLERIVEVTKPWPEAQLAIREALRALDT